MENKHCSNFINHVAAQLINFQKSDPLAFIQATVIVSSERFASHLKQALIQMSSQCALILPKIQPLMDISRDRKKEIQWFEFLLIVESLLRRPQFKQLNLSQDYNKLFVFYNFLNQLKFNAIDLERNSVEVPLNCLSIWEIYGQTILDLIQIIHLKLNEKGFLLRAENIINAWREFSYSTAQTDKKVYLIGITNPYLALKESFDKLKLLKNVVVIDPATTNQTLLQVCHDITQPLEMLEFQNLDAEALGVAYIVRDNLEQGFQNIAIITQDLELQLAVKGKLKYWGINIDDPNPQDWQKTQICKWIEIVGKFSLESFNSIINFIEHPFSQLHLSLEDKSDLASNLKQHWLKHQQAQNNIFNIDKFYHFLPDLLAVQLKSIIEILLPYYEDWFKLYQPNSLKLCEWLCEHYKIMSQVTNANAISWNQDISRLWQQTEQRFKSLMRIPISEEKISYQEYFQVFAGLFTDIKLVRSITSSQVKFIDFNDSFLSDSDYIICCGLNENIFPVTTLVSYGLPLNWLEAIFTKRKSDNDHAFIYLVNQPNIVFSRAHLRFGITQLPSSEWQELDIYLTRGDKKSSTLYKKITKILDFNSLQQKSIISQPFNWVIPADLKLYTLTIKDVENLHHDPFRFFMKNFLNLNVSNDDEEKFSSKDFGMLVHKLLGDSNSLQDFMTHSQRSLEDNDLPLAWSMKLKKIMGWLENFEGMQWHSGQTLSKNKELIASYKDLTLKGRVDQLAFKEDKIEIIDFKTGAIPLIANIQAGDSLQFSLLNYCAEQMGYEVDRATYIDCKNQAVKSFETELLQQAWTNVQQILDRYLDPQFRLISLNKNYHDNDFLERRQEWENL